MTKEEFIEYCRQQNSAAVDKLLEMGIEPVPCNCDYEHCKGWRWNAFLP